MYQIHYLKKHVIVYLFNIMSYSKIDICIPTDWNTDIKKYLNKILKTTLKYRC